ncbi:DNA repair protein RecO [Endozoicomonas sp. SM1973]|uniref:DNA repair protein RecO n=1 Tax=Spartinivicinus marinus TaxID=2994442 RepID=A0A853I5Q8_9GAMM|nr:DNA repair protein RecO [Spartinivicinus marinus]MCX4025490.1 DNA repair protein RecO [Spartinivicinus marinus]NYZ65281.1 DNA repair protein RecO [Spartinivicinus marinus]
MTISDDGYVLHTRPFQDNKSIAIVFTKQQGLQRIVFQTSKNSKKQPSFKHFLQPFQLLWLTWKGSGELKTGKTVELSDLRYSLLGKLLYCGLYLNELLIRLLPAEEASPQLFCNYQKTLAVLQEDPLQIEMYLRQFEFNLLAELGYAVSFEYDTDGNEITTKANYVFLSDQGFCLAKKQAYLERPEANLFSGSDLLTLASLPWLNTEAQSVSHQLDIQQVWTKPLKGITKRIARMALAPHLGSKPLMSRALFFKQR